MDKPIEGTTVHRAIVNRWNAYGDDYIEDFVVDKTNDADYGMVERIEERLPQNGLEKHCVDVFFEDGTVLRFFEIGTLTYKRDDGIPKGTDSLIKTGTFSKFGALDNDELGMIRHIIGTTKRGIPFKIHDPILAIILDNLDDEVEREASQRNLR